MGSRAIAVIAQDADVAERRFGIGDGTTGVVYTRTGRPFFADTTELVDRLRVAAAPLFESLDTDWLALDCELLPWSAKAMDLIKAQYASVGAAARSVLPEALDGAGAGRGTWPRRRRPDRQVAAAARTRRGVPRRLRGVRPTPPTDSTG